MRVGPRVPRGTWSAASPLSAVCGSDCPRRRRLTDKQRRPFVYRSRRGHRSDTDSRRHGARRVHDKRHVTPSRTPLEIPSRSPRDHPSRSPRDPLEIPSRSPLEITSRSPRDHPSRSPPQPSAARKLLRLHSLRQGRSAQGDGFLWARHSEWRAPEVARGKRRDGRCARAATEEEYSVEVRGSHLMREAISHLEDGLQGLT